LTGHAAPVSPMFSTINYYAILNEQTLKSKPCVPHLFTRHSGLPRFSRTAKEAMYRDMYLCMLSLTPPSLFRTTNIPINRIDCPLETHKTQIYSTANTCFDFQYTIHFSLSPQINTAGQQSLSPDITATTSAYQIFLLPFFHPNF